VVVVTVVVVTVVVVAVAIDSQPEFTLHQNIRKVGVINLIN
jgi:hypothetical protein